LLVEAAKSTFFSNFPSKIVKLLIVKWLNIT
jgi:hypothetical protein